MFCYLLNLRRAFSRRFSNEELHAKVDAMALDLSKLLDAVQKTQGQEASVIKLIGELKDELKSISANNQDANLQPQIDAMVATLDTGADQLAAAAISEPDPTAGPTAANTADPAPGDVKTDPAAQAPAAGNPPAA